MEHYEANGSRPRVKLLDSFSDFVMEKKSETEKGTNSTLVPQHPNDESHHTMLGCWDSFGILFLMSTLVLIGKLVQFLNGGPNGQQDFCREEFGIVGHRPKIKRQL
jgi:hypothetical protein